MTEMFWNAGK